MPSQMTTKRYAERRRGMWRSVLLLAGPCGLLAGCSWTASGGASGASSSPTTTAISPGFRLGPEVHYETRAVNGYRLVLRYPTSWYRYDWPVHSSFTDGLAYLSTRREHRRCKTTHTAAGSKHVICRYQTKRLPPGGIFVTWIAEGMPRVRAPPSGVHTRRLPSGWLETVIPNQRNTCPRRLDATTSITADFVRPTDLNNSFDMFACLRPPNIARHTKQVLTMLRDLQFVRYPATSQ